ncbi:MAG: superoxide dismutase [Lentisphaeria bacterium]|nr:superoxide dismutase [Lentisphaeria bacterium]
MTRVQTAVVVTLLSLVSGAAVYAHCQVPCGIFDDPVRFALLNEHTVTIEKAMKQIEELSADPKANANQITRWVLTKEEHAAQFTDIVTDYFLAQRIKAPGEGDKAAREKYIRQLELAHGMIVTVMKCRQTTDTSLPKALRSMVHDFEVLYTGKHDHQH